jgi:predicted AAA+ superfamily ATPase
MTYVQRIVETKCLELFSKYPAITVTGPRQSGKTSLVRHTFPNLPYVNLESREDRLYAQEDPNGFLQRFPDGAVLDEIQNVPDLSSWIQVVVDNRGKNGLFVLTGSRQFEVMEAVSQSLAGRTAMIRLLPFALEELSARVDIDQLLLKGFYPRIWDQQLNPVQALSDYITTYVERDLRKISQIHDLLLFEKFLGLCAGRIGQILNVSSLANDAGISHVAASQWITILEASYIVYRLKPYYANIGKRLVKSPKLYFYDVGLAARLLGIEQPEHVGKHPLRGNLFENLVVMESLKYRYNRVMPDNLFFFRDSKGNEIDLLILAGGFPIPVEIKSGQTLNPDYFKGFAYFDSLFPDSPHQGKGVLVYGGQRNETHRGIQVTDIQTLPRTIREM